MSYQRTYRGRRLPFQVRRMLSELPAGSSFVGEDDISYWFALPGANPSLDGFDIGNMFKRMFKFTPKSFTPGNIYKGFINTTLTVATSGLYQVLPKNLKKTVYEVGKVAVPIIAGGVLAFAAGPAIMGVLGPKLAAAGGLLGKAASTVGGPLLNTLGKMGASGQAQVAQNVTPEQIAQWDQTGTIPPSLVPLLGQALQNTMGPPSGNAALYDPSAMAAREMQVRESMNNQTGFDWATLALIGIPALAGVYFLTRK